MKKSLAFALSATLFSSVFADEDQIVARSAHEDVHQRIEYVIANGETNQIVHEWSVLQNGLNYWSPDQNEWLPSSTAIDLAEVGAVYQRGAFKARFAPNQNDRAGSVEITLPFPDERKLKIQTIGIAISDPASGDSVFLGELQDSNGLLDGNAILYPNAFSGVKADILVRVATGELHNDVVLREFPVQQGFLEALGLDQSKSRLEIWHQILENPEPDIRNCSVSRSDGTVDLDQQLFFGDMFFGPGTAFLLGNDLFPVASADGHLAVAKELFRDPDTHFLFLIESVRWSEALPHLATLPAKHQAQLDTKSLREKMQKDREVAGTSKRRQPARVMAAKAERPNRQMASITRGPIPAGPGYSIDYTVVASAANTRLAGNTTYYVSSSVVLSGTTTIEKGAVIKFSGSGSPLLLVTGAVDCQTALGMPAILTGKDDDSVGETITGSSGAPSGTYTTYGMLFSSANTTSLNIHDVHLRFLQIGLSFQGTNSHTAANIQAISCTKGLDTKNNTVVVHNYLTHNTSYPFISQNSTIRAEHLTAHIATQVFYDFGGSALYLTNSLLVGVSFASTNTSFDHVTSFTSDQPALFQTVKAGAHYLSQSDGYVYRNAGTANVSTDMQAILNATTTYPPLELTNDITSALTLYPQAQRDTDAPDLGAHYTPIDYILGSITVAENTSLILSNGVSVAIVGTNGPVLTSGATFASEGFPQTPNRITRYQAIQEQPTLFGSQPITLFKLTNAPAIKPTLSFRFTKIFVPAHATTSRYLCNSAEFGGISSRDSEWWNIYCSHEPASGVTSSYAMTNNIFGRCDLNFLRNTQTHQMTLGFWNNLFTRSALALTYATTSSSPPTWTIKDNLFENSTFSGTTVANIVCSNNGYYSTTIPGCSAGSDVTVTTLDFQSGVLGPYYYPTSGTGNLFTLIGAGSRTVGTATMVPYTVRVDQTKDTSTVDIGYHSMAMSGGLPLDTDSDGVPDYREDTNMNGVLDSGEGDWTSASDQGFNVWITQPKTNSIIP
jgi:hypothetical protein